MRRHLTATALLAMLLLSPMAAAGAEDDPEFNDAAFDAGAGMIWADLQKGWFEQLDAETLRINIVVNHLPEPHAGVVYAVLFDTQGESFHAALIHVEETWFEMGRFDRGQLEPVTSDPIPGRYTTGMNGMVQLDIPLERLPEGADRLTNLQLLAVDIKAGLADGPFLIMDEAEGTRDFTFDAPRGSAEPMEGATATPMDEGRAREEAAAPAASVAPAASTDEPERAVPGAGIPAVLLGIGAAALAAAARRR